MTVRHIDVSGRSDVEIVTPFWRDARNPTTEEDVMLKRPVKVWRAKDEGELRLPEDCLNALGLEEGTSGTVLVSPDRLVLTPNLQAGHAREQLAAVAGELELAEEELRRLARGMKRTPGETDDSVAVLECLLQDELLPAIRQLWELARPLGREDADEILDGLPVKVDG